jgi:hypothetical protein
MSTALRRDVLDLEAKHDALVREIDRKHMELDQVRAQIKTETERLAKIEAAIKKVKDRLGV